MKEIGVAEYEALIAGAEVLAADSHGLKVLRTPDGRIIKLFRLKRAWSSARLWPYAARFERNAQLLRAEGFITVEVLQTASSRSLRRNMVVYRELQGRTLRQFLLDPQTPAQKKSEAMDRLAALLARLHAQGILFRSIHFGNVLLQSDGGLALIDIADLHKRWFGRALSRGQRLRNFRHLLRYAEDRAALRDYGAERFVDLYLRESPSAAAEKSELMARLKALCRS